MPVAAKSRSSEADKAEFKDGGGVDSRQQKSGSDHKQKKRGCCGGRNFAIWMAIISISIGVYNKVLTT